MGWRNRAWQRTLGKPRKWLWATEDRSLLSHFQNDDGFPKLAAGTLDVVAATLYRPRIRENYRHRVLRSIISGDKSPVRSDIEERRTPAVEPQLLKRGVPTPDHGGQTAQDRPEVMAAPTMIELWSQRILSLIRNDPAAVGDQRRSFGRRASS